MAYAANPRHEALKIEPAVGGVTRACTTGPLCLTLKSLKDACQKTGCLEDSKLAYELTVLPDNGDATQPGRTYQTESLGDDTAYALWPQIIRFDGGLLVGLQSDHHAMYSGGGANSTTLRLIAFLPEQPPFEVLRVPLRSNVFIRACFSEDDVKERADACHDEYNFDARLKATAALSAAMPVLRFSSRATTFPGFVSRRADVLTSRPLRKRDLVTLSNRTCSYTRIYRYNVKTRSFAPNKRVPDCSDFNVP